MKKFFLVLASIGMLGSQKLYAQVEIGFKISPNLTVAHIRDRSTTPSSLDYTSDGETTNAGNQRGIGASVSFDFPINDTWAFGTGIGLTTKNLFITNRDGFYRGSSNYSILYTQIPLLLKYRTDEVFIKKLRLVFSGGAMIDLKTREALKGGDGAHYWNLAKNDYFADPTRGRNGKDRSMALFSPINLGLYISAGAEYQLLEKMAVYAGFSVNPSFLNMINPALQFDDANKTRVATDVRFTTTIISFDLGIKLSNLTK